MDNKSDITVIKVPTKYDLIFYKFVKKYNEELIYIYNNIFKDYHSILDFNTFVNFVLETSTLDGRLYKN